MPSDGKSSHCLWQGELTRGRFSVISSKGEEMTEKRPRV